MIDTALLLPPLLPWLICAMAVICGTLIQKLAGAGFGMIAAPAMTIAAPEWVPGTILLLGVLSGIGSFLGARNAVVRTDLPPGFAGRLLGAVLAAFIANAVVGTDALPVIIALVVLLAVALNLAGLSLPITAKTLFGAGMTAGVMGTLTGIGAPPMAILYSGVESRRSAATQNAFFGFGMIVSIGALAVAGLIRMPHIALALSLAPLVLLSLVAVRPLVARFERRAIRPWALGLAALSAVVLLAKSI
ncbi:TSUP family transporter [Vannielia litorea]|uniref:TSUP family transporter n=1 Tax=Vannielia litorea TaxID=1217970 RepID=UPI001FD35F99|nr:TSUP family transporter [Vannielia litorea]MBS8227380.1 sulfite exporter TauE/SafE family protein [Vannielia litorea]